MTAEGTEELRAQLGRRARQQECLADLGQRALEGAALAELARRACRCLVESVHLQWGAVLGGGDDVLVERGDRPPGALEFARGALVEGRAEVRETRIALPVDDWGAIAAVGDRESVLSREDVHFVRTLAHLLRAAVHRRAQERALRNSEARYRMVVEHSSDGIFLADQRGRYVEVNRRACEMTGYTADQLCSMELADLLTADEPPPQLDALRDGQVVMSVRGLQRADGSTFLAEIRGQLLPDGRLLGVVRDVTERELAEEALRTASQRLEQALRASRAGAWESDLVAGEYYWSPEMRELLRLRDDDEPSEELWYELVHPDDRGRARRASEAVQVERDDLDLEVRVIRRDGAMRWLRSTGKMVTDEAGRPASMYGIVLDITERKEAEIARARAERRSRVARRMESLGRLAGGVAHDFNNLLTVVIGGVDQVLLELDDPAVRPLLEQVREAGRRGSVLSRQLLAFGRPGADGVDVVDLRQRVAGLESLLRRVLGETVRLEVRQAGEPLPVEIAPGRLDQVLVNLCVNARDAMPEGGRLELTTRAEVVEAAGAGVEPGKWVVLTVRDEGEGMTAEQAARAFEPFYTTKPAGEGTGLGLASVYGIVTGRGGQVRLDTAPGEGSTFEVWLPRSARKPRAPAQPEPPPPNRDQGVTVLVVEDEPDVRQLLCRFLKREGHRVIEAEHGEHALQVVAETSGRIDAVVSDVVMPHLDGPGMVERLRADRPDLPVLYVTGYAGDAQREGRLHDAQILAKPFTYADLAAAMRELLCPEA